MQTGTLIIHPLSVAENGTVSGQLSSVQNPGWLMIVGDLLQT